MQEEDEHKDDQRRCITMEELLTLLGRTFPSGKPADIRAVLKRTVVFVFGAHALYICLPGQHDDAPIHRIQIQDLQKDVLADHHKVYYGKYKSGAMDKPADFDDGVSKEQDIEENMSRFSHFRKIQDYVDLSSE